MRHFGQPWFYFSKTHSDQTKNTHTYKHSHVLTHARVHSHTRTHTRQHTHTLIHTHTHTHHRLFHPFAQLVRLCHHHEVKQLNNASSQPCAPIHLQRLLTQPWYLGVGSGYSLPQGCKVIASRHECKRGCVSLLFIFRWWGFCEQEDDLVLAVTLHRAVRQENMYLYISVCCYLCVPALWINFGAVAATMRKAMKLVYFKCVCMCVCVCVRVHVHAYPL